jgi:hypothetical protein
LIVIFFFIALLYIFRYFLQIKWRKKCGLIWKSKKKLPLEGLHVWIIVVNMVHKEIVRNHVLIPALPTARDVFCSLLLSKWKKKWGLIWKSKLKTIPWRSSKSCLNYCVTWYKKTLFQQLMKLGFNPFHQFTLPYLKK